MIYKIIVVIIGYLAIILYGYLIKLLLRKYEIDISGLKSAGMSIGIIERILILTFVILNQYTAITIIFAAKSIARFNELKDRKTSEYYLIGTLLSITFALITGIIIRFLIGNSFFFLFFILSYNLFHLNIP